MITALHEDAPTGQSCRFDDRPAVATYDTDDGRTAIPVCAECLTRARPAYERAVAATLALAGGTAITRAQIDDLAAALTRAGQRWRDAAAQMPLIQEIHPGTPQRWPLATLTVDVVHDALTYPAVLYNDGTGWHATGWSEASRARIYRHGLPEHTDRDDDRADPH